jgi:formylglycine-generating enzyme required for sulfatase activity
MTAIAEPLTVSSRALDSVAIPGGAALVGTDNPVFAVDREGPLRRVDVAPFLMTSTAITNEQFTAFVAQTGYVTEAETFGWSFVFRDAVVDKRLIDTHVAGLPWWCKIDGANWFHPQGPGSTVEGLGELPVVHVSWLDAMAFAAWTGGRLPSEAEWEHAARGGLGDVRYPWGNSEPTADDPRCHFGQIHCRDPDAAKIKPVAATAFSANRFGLFNMVGNVWEWTADTAIRIAPEPPGTPPSKILKGGSYLCHPQICFRYRIAARIANTSDSTLGHTGFRVVFST